MARHAFPSHLPFSHHHALPISSTDDDDAEFETSQVQVPHPPPHLPTTYLNSLDPLDLSKLPMPSAF
ncbi:hypothetical protein Tco_0121828 [Tanacetum coccineum]